jgi:putative hydrolase of HD superfamily
MLATLIELQRLKRLERTGWTLRGLPNGTESVASHSFGVGVTAMMLADEVKARGLTVDCERVLRMALLHDWAETRVGDMPKTASDYFGAEARKTAETRAFDDIVSGVGPCESEYKALYRDYEERNSLEARLVKAADVIDLLVQAYALEHAGAHGLDEFWQVANDADFNLPTVAQEVVKEVLQSLLKARNLGVRRPGAALARRSPAHASDGRVLLKEGARVPPVKAPPGRRTPKKGRSK